jgi:hypothetical protein
VGDANSRDPHVLRVVTFNLQNLFDLVAEPNKLDSKMTPSLYQFETKLEKLTLAVRDELDYPQIIVAQEIDNAEVLQELGDRINKLEDTSYRAVSFDTSDRRSIEVGFLFDESRVELRESFQLDGMDVARAFGPISPRPGREPIIGRFAFGDAELRLAGVHLKSKGGVSPIQISREAKERFFDEIRLEQARVLRRFAESILGEDPRALLCVAGDFNDFRYVDEIAGSEQVLSVASGDGGKIRLVDVADRLDEGDRYTFIHTGAGHLLDHMLVSAELERYLIDVRIHHFNAGQPRSAAADPSTPIRCSDHDPLEAAFGFGRA